MKPIRKNELEHWANLIDKKFETRGEELQRLKNLSQLKLSDYLVKLSNTNQWELYHVSDCNSIEAFEKQFEEACRAEAKRHLKKQPIAKDINNLEAIKEHAKNILMSGRDINITVSALNQLCESKGISLNAPKSLLQLSE